MCSLLTNSPILDVKSVLLEFPKRLSPLVDVSSTDDAHALSILVAFQCHAQFIPNISQKAKYLFETFNKFSRGPHSIKKRYADLLSFLRSDVVLKSFSSKDPSVVITDVSPISIGAVLE